MEKALREELIEYIPALRNKIYATNAPKNAKEPYLVYARLNTGNIKTFDEPIKESSVTYMFSIMAPKYEDMIALRDEVKGLIVTLPGSTIGAASIYIEDININNIHEQYEHELQIHRGIIDFTIYKEVE